MQITRVIYNDDGFKAKEALAVCSIIFDDCFKLKGISLYKGPDGYYLTFPSRQDVYKKVRKLNEDLDIKFPENTREKGNSNKSYEEFFHPVSNKMYSYMLSIVIDGYEKNESDIRGHFSKVSYRLS